MWNNRLNTALIASACMIFGLVISKHIYSQTAKVVQYRNLKWCNLYDWSARSYDMHSCLITKWTPSFPICIHDTSKDTAISKNLKTNGVWEPHILGVFTNLLNRDRELAVIDIGANIGEYTLLAAAMGRPVVAVEARLLHVQIIHHALTLYKPQLAADSVVLLHNAVSDTRDVLHLTLPHPKNQGTMKIARMNETQTNIASSEQSTVRSIYLDDLLEVIQFRKAIMKMDIEGSEQKAMTHCERLLRTVHVAYILMEWVFMNRKSDQERGNMIASFTRLGYKPFDLNKTPLAMTSTNKWPIDIIWKHELDLF